MIYLLIFIYMLLFPITMVALLYKILDKLEKGKQEPVQNQKKKRTHPGIGRTSYISPLAGRINTTAYDKYKNKEGLYEPITPSNGIKIKKKED